MNPEAPEFQLNTQDRDEINVSSETQNSHVGDIGVVEENLSDVNVDTDPCVSNSPRGPVSDEPKDVGKERSQEQGANSERDGIRKDEVVGVRRSSRDRVPPKKLTYPTLGNPLVSIMHSILSGLDEAFSKSLALDTAPYNTFDM